MGGGGSYAAIIESYTAMTPTFKDDKLCPNTNISAGDSGIQKGIGGLSQPLKRGH